MEHTQGRRPVFELEDEREAAKIKVIGLGGGGSNAVNRMMAAPSPGWTSSSPTPICRRSSPPRHP